MRHLLILILAAAAGCATAAVPADRMAASQASVRAAAEVGARDVPAAALHLQLAEEQVDQAKLLIKKDYNERARFVLMRAEADAELALALAREQSERAEAQRAIDKVRSLQQ